MWRENREYTVLMLQLQSPLESHLQYVIEFYVDDMRLLGHATLAY